DFLKTSLRNLARDYWRKKQKEGQRIPAALGDIDAEAPSDEEDASFIGSWRAELLARTWSALAKYEEETGRPFCAVPRLKTEEPALRSDELAKRLSRELDKTLSVDALRQILHRAREAFADLLLDEVQRTISVKDSRHLEEELVDLKLLDYCQQAL